MLALKTSTFTGALVDNVMPLIMWGRVELPTGINIVTKADNVKLLRAVACVQVKKGAVDATNGLNDFTVQGRRLRLLDPDELFNNCYSRDGTSSFR